LKIDNARRVMRIQRHIIIASPATWRYASVVGLGIADRAKIK